MNAHLGPCCEIDERGASAAEYGLLLAGVAALIVLVVFTLGTNVSDLFGRTCQSAHSQAFGGSSC